MRRLCLFNGCLSDVFSHQIKEALNGHRSKCGQCLVSYGETLMRSKSDRNLGRPDYEGLKLELELELEVKTRSLKLEDRDAGAEFT